MRFGCLGRLFRFDALKEAEATSWLVSEIDDEVFATLPGSTYCVDLEVERTAYRTPLANRYESDQHV